MPMLIDTHCHLDASEFLADRQAVIQRAAEQGVGAIVIPAVALSNFDVVRDLAHSFKGGVYALGIHPICVPDATESDLVELELRVQQSPDDPRSEEHTSELQSLMRISYAVFCLKKKKT